MLRGQLRTHIGIVLFSLNLLTAYYMHVNIFYAIIVYIFICIQLYYFVFMNNASLQYAFLLGSSTYGIYEFTNMALLNKWDYKMALLDTLWGGILYSLSTFIIRNI